jgi:hypothetical protein
MKSDVEEFISDFSRFYILTILYEGPAHGYRIISKFRKRIGKEISPSLVYTVKPIGEKERKVFELTAEGRELCTRLFKRFANLISIAIEPTLEVCAHCGCKVYEGGYHEAIDGKETTFCCKHCANSYKQERKSLT